MLLVELALLPLEEEAAAPLAAAAPAAAFVDFDESAEEELEAFALSRESVR